MRKRLKLSLKTGGMKSRQEWSKNVTVTVKQDKTKVYVINTEHAKKINALQEKYNIGKKIGEGAHSRIYLISEKDDINSKYAAKVSRTFDDEMHLQAKLEYQLMTKLNHPNICHVYDFIENDCPRESYMIMEYIELNSLKSMIGYFKKQREKIIKILFQNILKGIAYMHSQSICHRDIWPNNIMCSNDGVITKIVDLGVSRALPTIGNALDSYMMTPTGCFAYRAPEVIGGAQYDENIDCWAVGVMLYEVITGKHPFIARFNKDTADNIMTNKPDFNDTAFAKTHNKSVITNLLKQLLEKDGSKRISAKNALKHPWFKIANLKVHYKLSNNNLNSAVFQKQFKGYSHKNLMNNFYQSKNKSHRHRHLLQKSAKDIYAITEKTQTQENNTDFNSHKEIQSENCADSIYSLNKLITTDKQQLKTPTIPYTKFTKQSLIQKNQIETEGQKYYSEHQLKQLNYQNFVDSTISQQTVKCQQRSNKVTLSKITELESPEVMYQSAKLKHTRSKFGLKQIQINNNKQLNVYVIDQCKTHNDLTNCKFCSSFY